MEDGSPISDILSPAAEALVREVVETDIDRLEMDLDFCEVIFASELEEEEMFQIREVESDILLAAAVQQAYILGNCQILSQLVNSVCGQHCLLSLVIAVMHCLCGLLPHVGDMPEGFFELYKFLGDRLRPLIARHATEGCMLVPLQELQAHSSPPGQNLPCPCGILFRMEVFWGACRFVPDGDEFTYDFSAKAMFLNWLWHGWGALGHLDCAPGLAIASEELDASLRRWVAQAPPSET